MVKMRGTSPLSAALYTMDVPSVAYRAENIDWVRYVLCCIERPSVALRDVERRPAMYAAAMIIAPTSAAAPHLAARPATVRDRAVAGVD
jgi:hypothetical protein